MTKAAQKVEIKIEIPEIRSNLKVHDNMITHSGSKAINFSLVSPKYGNNDMTHLVTTTITEMLPEIYKQMERLRAAGHVGVNAHFDLVMTLEPQRKA